MKVSLFEISYKKKTFSQYSFLLNVPVLLISTFVCLSLKLNSVVHTVLSNLFVDMTLDIICAKHSYTSWLKAHKERSMDASHLNFCLLYWNTVHLGV